MPEPQYVDRPPRIQPDLPFDTIKIPKPPEKPPDGQTRLIQIGLPLITIVGYIMVSSFGGPSRSLGMLLPMALAVVASTAFSVYTYRNEKRQRREIEQAYADRLVELTREMEQLHEQQRRFYAYNYPEPESCRRLLPARRAPSPGREPPRRQESRLWERRVGDDDFAVVRLGIGTRPSTVVFALDEVEQLDDPQARAALKLADDSRFVSEVPVTLALRQRPAPAEPSDAAEPAEQRPPTPVTHALAVAGAAPAVYAFSRALIAHLTVFHAPSDARLYVVAPRRDEWAWAVGLPHCQEGEHGSCVLFTDGLPPPDDNDDDDADERKRYLEGLRRVLAQRKLRLQQREESEDQNDPTQPFCLLVVDMLDPNSGLQQLVSEPALTILLAEGAALGATVIFLVPERVKGPSGCQAVIEIEEVVPATNSKASRQPQLFFRYAEVGMNSLRYVGVADSVPEVGTMAALADQLSALAIRQGPGAALPSAVSYLGLAGYGSLADLRDDAWKRWRATAGHERARWLRVRLGMLAGNKPRPLEFSAKRDGVHGMVAGSTGSGKSELLISLITGLAVNYDPSTLNFVLVDYKGGGAFNEFEALPHCVDIITNLAADGVTRMFTAIQAEMRRRQALNVATGTKNIVEYRSKGMHLAGTPQFRGAYPFLFIIIDEFAEMIADRAEYKAQLESITRVGRAQGVSLLLAAQRPSGVTDQMRSNIKFRICLRVETPAESREMLRRVDAAFLPTGVPGRGYLQVGNEEIELIQAAYTGEPYVDPSRSPEQPVVWPGRGGQYNPAEDLAPPELYKVIISTLAELAQKQSIPKQLAPWPEFLPTQLALSQLLLADDPALKPITNPRYLSTEDITRITLGRAREGVLTLSPALNRWLTAIPGWVEPNEADPAAWREFMASYALRPVVGLVDNPYESRQHPLVVNLTLGHVVLYGASGWGKSTFLCSLGVSLCATHSPSALHLYLLDLGGRSLRRLAGFPHVGAVITPDEEAYVERVEQLLRELNELIDRRKLLLSTAGSPDIQSYALTHPADPQPAAVVLIDNFNEFIATFGQQADNVDSTLQRFITLARQSRAYGVHIVITANQPSELSSNLTSLFLERLTLRLADSSDYRTIVGGAVDEIGAIPGRGYLRAGAQPLAFQVAVPLDLPRDGSDQQELDQIAAAMWARVNAPGRSYKLPVKVDALPRSSLLRKLIADAEGLALDDAFLDELARRTQAHWERSRSAASADWLAAMIGVVSGNRRRTLQLEAKQDGVHGLIAGGTGSGKSELLMTLIVSLALRYAPDILNFVLVDYKGGGAFQPFEQLPHVVDVVTNLNKAGVKRVFTAVRAEMERRQALNKQTDTKDIIDYRSRGLHLRGKPYPHLFIIIDEYAEMIGDNPEFAEELASITRLGRAQGVNLLLASQRPTGISDQMRANIKLRICLRVEQEETSRELLRRGDAAFLPNGMPGRGYLQVGNEQVELIQVAWTGESIEQAPPRENGERPRFFDLAVGIAQRLLGSALRPQAPWPPPLRSDLTFATPLVQEKLDPASVEILTGGHRTAPTTLNPFLEAWLAGAGRWHGLDWDRTALRGIAGLLDNPYAARQLPLIVDLTRGHAVLFGASGYGKSTFLRALALSMAATHSPGELHMHVLDLGGRALEALRALPHVGTLISPDDEGYEERVQQLWRQLAELIDRRKELLSKSGAATVLEYNVAHQGAPLPAQLVLIDNLAELIESFSLAAAQKRDDSDSPLDAFVALARQGRAFGIHFVITAARPNQLSSKLYSLFNGRFTLRLADASEYSIVVGGGAGEIEELNGRGFARVARQPLPFQVALIPGAMDANGRVRGEAQRIRELGARMDELIAAEQLSLPRPLRIDALPRGVSYRELLARAFGVRADEAGFLDALRERMATRWAEQRTPEHADWLAVPIGMASGNQSRTLHLEAQQDGVHGLIAGGTGSGKSELLMTLIVGLAAMYPPDILTFVLVDYKGGGAFKPFEQLPHVVDVVTNLNKAAVHRMFTAINAEIRSRQQLNADTGTKDIVEYRSKGLHLSRAPYPHLFVIIDEYAEMIGDNPDYRMQLESITRVGRAQGVNLLLASQRPTGVSDQMRANIKLRICLRVEQAETSRELLRRPDAAFLPNGLPGRGYLQVGNEQIELIQMAWTGEAQSQPRPRPAEWPQRSPRQPADQAEPPRLFNAVVSLAVALNGGQKARRPWPGFLPDQLSLETPLTDGKGGPTFQIVPAVERWLTGEVDALWPGVDWGRQAMRAAVGIVDVPAEARQEPLEFDLTRYHLAIFGDSGGGKSGLLRTLALSLAATHRPDELHLYMLDLGGRGLRTLERLPHTGAVIYADEETFEERMNRLLDTLGRLVESRQRLFADAGASQLYEYNAAHPLQALPAILVLIDNIAEITESYEALVNDTLIPLVRRSLSAGVSFVVTANGLSNLGSRLGNLFTERVTFRQSVADRYLDIVGRGAVEIDDQPGRGYRRVGRQPLLFQAALPVGVMAAGERPLRPEADDLADLVAAMSAATASRGFNPERLPTPIGELPGLVPLAELLARPRKTAPSAVTALVGLNGDLELETLDLRRIAPHLAIIGPALSGKTTALRSLALSLAVRHSPSQLRLVLVDLQRRLFDYDGAANLGELPHVLAAVSEKEQLEPLIALLEQEARRLAAREAAHELFVIVDSFEEFNDDLGTQGQLRLATLARKHGRDGLHFVIAATPDTSNVSELRRRIMAANLGVGLRSAQAVEALRVMRVPAGLRDRAMPPGRGYLVRSNLPTLVQIAWPYELASDPVAAGGEEASRAAALDAWVRQVQAAYPERVTPWAVGQPAPAALVAARSLNGKPKRLYELVQLSAQRELTRLKSGKLADQTRELLAERLIREPQAADEPAQLLALAWEAFLREQEAQGMERDLAESLFNPTDEPMILSELERMLAPANGHVPGKEPRP